MSDMVNHPAHYEGKFECKEVMLECFGKEAVMDFYLLCAFKYLFRCQRKHETPKLDIEKAHWYLSEWIKLSREGTEEAGKIEEAEDDFCDDFYTLEAENQNLVVYGSVGGLIQGLRFKADNIKARANPKFFSKAADMLEKLSRDQGKDEKKLKQQEKETKLAESKCARCMHGPKNADDIYCANCRYGFKKHGKGQFIDKDRAEEFKL